MSRRGRLRRHHRDHQATLDIASLSNLALWYDADNVTGTDATRFSPWVDLSGNSRDATASGDPRPLIQNNEQNGHNVVEFDGTDTVLDIADFTLAQPWTIFLTMIVTNQTNGDTIFDGDSLNEGRLFQSGPFDLAIYAGSQVTITAPGTSAWHQYTITFNGASSSIRVDNGAASQSGDAGAADPGAFQLGVVGGKTGSYFDGQLGEIIVFNGAAITGRTRNQLERYLMSKWLGV